MIKITAVLCVFALVFQSAAADRGDNYVTRNLPKQAVRIPVNAVVFQTNAPPPLQPVTITNQINPDWLKPPTEPFTLGPGDKLEIELLDDPGSRQIVPVGPDGKVYFSILPGIDVWGLTLTQAKQALESQFTKYMRDKPQVGVTLRAVESKRVWLLGRFQVPGAYVLTNQVTLLEALSLAGGSLSYTTAGAGQEVSLASNSEELADLRHAFVVRKGQMVPVDFYRLLREGDLSQNIYLQADDFVYLPPARAREIYVMGAVNEHRTVEYQDGMTVVSAIANGGGTFRDSYLEHVAVVRGSLAQPQIAIVNYREMIKGHAPDVALQPGDIVFVPLKPYRLLNRYANLIANTFVTSVAINEGARAVEKKSTPTGILIPLGSTITVNGGIPLGPSTSR